MKIVEIDIDKTSGAKSLAEEFRLQNLQRGDTLKFHSSKISDDDFIKVAILVVAIFALAFYDKKNTDFANAILKDVFNDRDIKDIEQEIAEEYGIELIMEGKDDEEQKAWQELSKKQLLKAYSTDEPEYTLSMIMEPNPGYKK